MKVYKSTRKYTCPHCDHRATRGDLVAHVSEEHEELIPEGFTAARVVFNYLNNTTHGICQICYNPTEWNEDKWRYDSIHPTEQCRQLARNKALENHKKAFNGKTTLLNDPDHQAKMLANRSISGEYTFSDGSILKFTGSYEKRFLEFCDNILHLLPWIDIFNIDGTDKNLIIPYTYKGNQHFWIPDYYIKPFNLMIDVKDGGSNKNNREMKEYREKQIAKENAIKKQGKFNYLRLTDNQFDQLLSIFLDIKFSLLSDDEKKVHIHEYCGNIQDNTIYRVAYSESGYVIDGYGIMYDKMDSSIFVIENNKLVMANTSDFLKDKKYIMEELTGTSTVDIMNTISSMVVNETEIDYMSLYEMTEDKTDARQIYISEDGHTIEEDILEHIFASYSYRMDNTHMGIPIINEEVRTMACSITEGYQDLEILEEVDGYFLYNKVTGNRTVALEDLSHIQPYMLDTINSKF